MNKGENYSEPGEEISSMRRTISDFFSGIENTVFNNSALCCSTWTSSAFLPFKNIGSSPVNNQSSDKSNELASFMSNSNVGPAEPLSTEEINAESSSMRDARSEIVHFIVFRKNTSLSLIPDSFCSVWSIMVAYWINQQFRKHFLWPHALKKKIFWQGGNDKVTNAR